MKTDKQQEQEDNGMIDEGKFYHYWAQVCAQICLYKLNPEESYFM